MVPTVADDVWSVNVLSRLVIGARQRAFLIVIKLNLFVFINNHNCLDE
jgi:hypothetical protein